MKTLIAILVIATVTSAQTLTPVSQEHKGPRARGEIVATNAGVIPLIVTVEPRLLTAAQGAPAFGNLQGVDLRMSETSARLGPHETRAFAYDIRCGTLPCAVILFARFAPPHKEGLNVATHIGSTTYICEKPKGCRESVLRGLGLWKEAK